MKRNRTNSQFLLILLIAACLASPASAQSSATTQKTGNVNTTTKITFHGGPIMSGVPGVYFIWYGCWDGTCGNAGNPTTQSILEDFVQNVGGSPYFQINAMYPNMFGQTPSGALVYAGGVVDRYSHGMELTAPDIAGI